jgi:uncharacterized protein (TIGR03437 family)
LCLILWGALTQLAVAQTPLSLRVAAENVSAGSWAQIQIYADQPALIARGSLALDLDPQVFGPIERVAAFSANGDASALARVDGTHVEISVMSPSGGIGQLPDVPIVAVRVPVLSGARLNGFVSLSMPFSPLLVSNAVNYPADAWAGPNNQAYSVTLASAQVRTDAPVTISGVSPAGGFQPAGTIVTITGTGFAASTKITAAGLAFSSLQVISPTRIDAVLASAAELTGARLRVELSKDSFIDYFASPPSQVISADLANPVPPAGAHAVFPFSEQKATSMLQSNPRPLATLLQNPTLSPTDVRVHEIAFGGKPVGSRHVTLAPGAVISLASQVPLNQYLIDSDTSLRMLQYTIVLNGIGTGTSLGAATPWNGTVPPIPLLATPNQLTVNYQAGAAAPDPRTVRFFGQNGAFTGASIQVTGASWLSASQPDSSGAVTVSFNPAGLAPGTYTGTIIGTPPVPPELSEFPAATATVQVTLVVSSQPVLIVDPMDVNAPANTTYYSPVSLAVKSNGTPASFTASATTTAGGNWLSLDQTSGTTPATINVQANTAGLPGGFYFGTVSLVGPLNTVNVQVTLAIYPIPKPPLSITSGITETREEGTGNPTATLSLSVKNKTGPLTLQVTTDDGANWLSASVFDQNLNAVVMSHIDSAALPPGAYHGTIIATAGGETVQARVTLNILPKPHTLLRVSPSSFTFQTSVGVESPAQTMTIDSDQPALIDFTFAAPVHLKSDGNSPLTAPSVFSLSGYSDSPGVFTGSITIKNSFGSTTVLITVEVTGSAERAPVLTSVVNGASHRAMALAPGEIITLHGIGIGPQPTGPQLDAQGRISTGVGTNTRVEINDQPAPVLYASPSQWNVIVPYEVAAHSSATVRVVTYGQASRVWTLPVAPAAPAIFTLTASGVGPGAVLNQDNTVNSPTNPAPVGTIIQIYATGGGQSNPPAETGSVTPGSGGGGNQLPIKAFFAGDEAAVVFAGPAPTLASGVLQVNAVVPNFGRPTENKTLRVTLEINGLRSAPVDVTIR